MLCSEIPLDQEGCGGLGNRPRPGHHLVARSARNRRFAQERT